jgi:protein-S-isoprenylcysteine O-methyltransferase Ste14
MLHMNYANLRSLRSSVLGTLALAALIFLSAGTLSYWQGCIYVLVIGAASAVLTAYLAIHDPELLQRRLKGGPAGEQEPAQKIISAFAILVFLLLIAVSSLDHRFGWSRVPWWIAIAGNVLAALSFFSFYLVVRVNSFAASTVCVEPGQQVVSSGPYAWVRHPMYSGGHLLLIGTPLALGSWWGLLIVPLFLPVIAWRILNEEAVLTRDLPGYPAYQRQVRYRLIPFVW